MRVLVLFPKRLRPGQRRSGLVRLPSGDVSPFVALHTKGRCRGVWKRCLVVRIWVEGSQRWLTKIHWRRAGSYR